MSEGPVKDSEDVGHVVDAHRWAFKNRAEERRGRWWMKRYCDMLWSFRKMEFWSLGGDVVTRQREQLTFFPPGLWCGFVWLLKRRCLAHERIFVGRGRTWFVQRWKKKHWVDTALILSSDTKKNLPDWSGHTNSRFSVLFSEPVCAVLTNPCKQRFKSHVRLAICWMILFLTVKSDG